MDGRGNHCEVTGKILVYILIFTLISDHSGRPVLQTTEASQLTNSTELQAEEAGLRHQLYRLGPQILDWDVQRAKWLQENPAMRLNRKGKPRTILVTSSQSETCPGNTGDHYLLKFLKNKIDYARLHDIDIYYNMVQFDEKMTGFFIKLPLVRKLMLTHPEAEWIWWMDSDALFTEMSFEIPLEKYKDHNMIIHGWNGEVYEKKSWIGLNAGIFLLRNCKWSLDLLDIWAALGEDYADNQRIMGTLLSEALSGGRPDDLLSDDQSALIYLLSTSHTAQLKPKVFLEDSFDLHGYWVMAMEKMEAKLNDFPKGKPGGQDWSFVTHFVGCKFCSGSYASYNISKCLEVMERAFNLADNQVLDIYGYQHENLTSHQVMPTRPRD